MKVFEQMWEVGTTLLRVAANLLALAVLCVSCVAPGTQRSPDGAPGAQRDAPVAERSIEPARESSAASPGDVRAAEPVELARGDSAPGLARADGWFEKKRERKEKKRREKTRPENARKRAEERMLRRLDENGRIPPNALLRAKTQSDHMPVLELVPRRGDGAGGDAGIANWEWLGPGNIGGRVRALLIHPDNPDTMWAGSAGGGIWKTTNGGGSWSPLDDFLPSIAVGCMALDPNDPDVLYAGTGESFTGGGLPGAGVFKSIDGGATWTQLAATAPPVAVPPNNPTNVVLNPWAFVNRLSVNPVDSLIVLAATEGGIWRSPDGGQTWTPVDTTGRTLDVRFQLEAPGNRAVAGMTGGVALFSNDFGVTWSRATLDDDLFTTRLSASANAGDTTIEVDSTAGFVTRDRIRLGPIVDPNTEVVGISTVDGDNTISLGSALQNDHGSQLFVQQLLRGRVELAWGSGGTVYASVAIGGGSIYRSDDFGVNYELLASPENLPNYLCSAFFSFDDINSCQGAYDNVIWVSPVDNDSIVVGGIDNWRDTDVSDGLQLTRISDWEAYHLGTSAHADNHQIVAHPDFDGDTNRTVFFGNDGGVQKADDIESPLLGTFGWKNLANNLGITQFYAGAASRGGSVIVGGAQDNGNLRYTSFDGAQGWLQCLDCTGDGGPCAIDPVFPNIIYQTKQNLTVWKSIDGGNLYLPAMIGLDETSSLFIAPLVMDPNDRSDLIAGGRSIWLTTNGALSWESIRGPQSGNCSAVAIGVGNGDRVWLGYSSGLVSRTTTDRNTWVDVNGNGPNPLPGRFVTDIAIDPTNSSEVYVTLGGFGGNSVWYTNDDGATWQPRNGPAGSSTTMGPAPPTELPLLQVNTITVHPTNPNWIYVGTDLGVYASEDKGLNWNRTALLSGVGHEGPVNTEVSDLFWQASRLIAATFGRGMFRTGEILGGCLDECVERGQVCQETCSEVAGFCQEGCDGVRDGCQTACESTGDICREPCLGAGELCREGCDAVSEACDAACDSTVGECETGCATTGEGCHTLCEDTFALCGPVCQTTGNACRAACSGTFGACSNACAVAGDGCRAVCETTQATCDSACSSTSRACRSACTTTFNNCEAPCEATGNSCRSACTSTFNSCGPACVATGNSCRSVCTGTFNTCNSTCVTTGNGCRTACANVGDSCREPCVSAGTTCRSACTGTGNNCRSGCASARTACRLLCAPGGFGTECRANCDSIRDTCVSTCNSTQNSCNSACNSTQDACEGTCDTAETTCVNSCNSVQTGCVSVCTGARNTCNTACNTAQTRCSAVCAPAKTACDSTCNTTQNTCVGVCAGARTTCNGVCDTNEEACESICATTRAACTPACGETEKLCVDGCDDARSQCTGACTTTQNECAGQCESSRTGCVGTCDTTEAVCVNACAGAQTTCTRVCEGTHVACRTACDAPERTCVAACDTAEGVCARACGVTHTACTTTCSTVEAACSVPCEPMVSACLELCGQCGVCADAGSTCRDLCEAPAEVCRTACDTSGTACRTACRAADTICRAPCEVTATACRAACALLPRGEQAACNRLCDAGQAACARVCDTALTACGVTCDGVEADCRAPCDFAAGTCAAGCDRIESECEALCVEPAETGQVPGDCNQDGAHDVSDMICLLRVLFMDNPAADFPCGPGGPPEPDGGGSCQGEVPPTGDVALLDFDGDGVVNMIDVTSNLRFLFLDGPPHCLGTACVEIPGCPAACLR